MSLVRLSLNRSPKNYHATWLVFLSSAWHYFEFWRDVVGYKAIHARVHSPRTQHQLWTRTYSHAHPLCIAPRAIRCKVNSYPNPSCPKQNRYFTGWSRYQGIISLVFVTPLESRNEESSLFLTVICNHWCWVLGNSESASINLNSSTHIFLMPLPARRHEKCW